MELCPTVLRRAIVVVRKIKFLGGLPLTTNSFLCFAVPINYGTDILPVINYEAGQTELPVEFVVDAFVKFGATIGFGYTPVGKREIELEGTSLLYLLPFFEENRDAIPLQRSSKVIRVLNKKILRHASNSWTNISAVIYGISTPFPTEIYAKPYSKMSVSVP